MTSQIAEQISVHPRQVAAVQKLLDEGASIPFIARYRKEQTGGLDEVVIAEINDAFIREAELNKRRTYILKTLKEQGALTPNLSRKIEEARSIDVLEDLYLPFKKKRKTKADVARDRGLEPLAKMIMAQNTSNLFDLSQRFIRGEVLSYEQAVEGAQMIIAEWINEDAFLREKMRHLFIRKGIIFSKIKRGKKDEADKFKDYFDYQEKIEKIPSYRYLGILRGENEGYLSIQIRPSREEALRAVLGKRIKSSGELASVIEEAAVDAYDRLLAPSIENQVKKHYKEKADAKAIEVFANNLKQLLMAPPLGEKSVLSIDPGFRTGCKVTCLNARGELLKHTTIFPHPPVYRSQEALHQLISLCRQYEIQAIAIGDATAGRETFEWINGEASEDLPDRYMVNESGASIYSTSDIARKEFPDLDATVRGSISIGRRLMDPLAELIKIDPKSIGVGEYQHDVNQSELNRKLEEVVISCVNQIGVQLNTASPSLLAFVSGLGESLAQNIVDYRSTHGPFEKISELRKVARLGDKAFEQSSGFLRIRDAKNPLDNTGVHPESYGLVRQMAQDQGLSVKQLMANASAIDEVDLEKYVTQEIGMPTLNDIIKELKQPGLDVRGRPEVIRYDDAIRSFEDVKEGMKLEGVIKNITGFGAFVDIGIKESGLVHISQLADRYVSHPSEVVHINQRVRVVVIGIDDGRRRIQLSMKAR